MIRKASIMHVFPDYYEEYKRRHDKLWPEMAEALKRHGAHNYSIFLDEEMGGYLLSWKSKIKKNGSKWLKLIFSQNGGLIWSL